MADLNFAWEDALFGDWQANDAIAKSLGGDTPSPPSLWVMDLPANTRSASQLLAQQRSQLLQGQREVALAEQRLAEFLDAWAPTESETTASKSLGLESEASPENRLAATLATVNQPQSKGLLDNPLQAARAEFERFSQRVRELIANYAQIETTVASRAIGRTMVGWAGDFKSAWNDDISVEQFALHKHNVRLALAQRALLMKLLVVVSTGAARIAIRLATPGAQLLAIPAVWQFVKDVIAQIQALNAAASN